MISESIYVSKEAYIKLREISREQRGCKPLPRENYDRIISRMATARKKGDMIRLTDGDMGGGDGVYHGKMTSWSVKDLKRILEENGFTWEQGEDVEFINVYL